MSGDVRITFRPLDYSTWVSDGHDTYRRAGWKATYDTIVDDLVRELEMLDVREAVIEVDTDERSIRQDGLPRAQMRPASPAVRLTFRTDELGPQCYMDDKYDRWQHNLRAIGLTLQRLRLIDEYGATRSRQQYRGFAALPMAAPSQAELDAKRDPLALLAELAGAPDVHSHTPRELRDLAARRNHPDSGGSDEAMARVNRAWDRHVRARGIEGVKS